MARVINITIRDKIAVADKSLYICGNSDFIVHFDFDADWKEYDTKTARFIGVDGTYKDVVFDGNECPMPILSDTYLVKVGVYAGNLRTTTSAMVSAKKSILCGGNIPAAPTDDVYNQIMTKLNMISDDIGAAVEDYLEDHPIEGGVDFETDETLTLENGILSVNRAEEPEPDNTLPITSAAVYVTVGNINALLETI